MNRCERLTCSLHTPLYEGTEYFANSPLVRDKSFKDITRYIIYEYGWDTGDGSLQRIFDGRNNGLFVRIVLERSTTRVMVMLLSDWSMKKISKFRFFNMFFALPRWLQKVADPHDPKIAQTLSVVLIELTNGILTKTICLVAFLILLVRVVWSSIPGLENRKGSIFFHSHFRSFTSFS